MPVRNFATFASRLPDDAVERDDEIVTPGGCNVMTAFAARLRELGYATSEVAQHSFYGWSFDARGPEGRIWCVLQWAGSPWLLIVQDRRWFFERAFRAGTFTTMLRLCDSALRSLDHVSGIEWFTEREYGEHVRARHRAG